jgi:hypothetical protein
VNQAVDVREDHFEVLIDFRVSLGDAQIDAGGVHELTIAELFRQVKVLVQVVN